MTSPAIIARAIAEFVAVSIFVAGVLALAYLGEMPV